MASLELRFRSEPPGYTFVGSTYRPADHLPPRASGSVSWGKGARALVLLLLQAAAWHRAGRVGPRPTLESAPERPDPHARALYTALTKNINRVRWLAAVLGGDDVARCVLVPTAAVVPGGCVVGVALDEAVLPVGNITVRVDGRDAGPRDLDRLIAAIVGGRPPGRRTARATSALASALEDRYSVRAVGSTAEFDDFWALDSGSYPEFGEGNYAERMRSVLFAWWSAFPEGLTAFYHGNRMVGGMGIWPLMPPDDERLAAGQIAEHEIGAGGMARCRAGERPMDCCYFGGVFLDERHRRETPYLMLAALLHWKAAVAAWVRYPLRVLALGSSAEGVNLMQNHNFRRIDGVRNAADNLDIYEGRFRAPPGMP